MNKEKYQGKTDVAWNKLYDRLDRDGLLAGNKKKPHTVRMVAWSAVAAAAVVLIVLMMTGPVHKNAAATDQLLSQRNDESGTALVKTLEDHSTVFLSDNSTLRYPSHFASKERRVKLEGEALFDVAHNRQHPFIIDTKEMTIQVLGTCFNVKSGRSGAFELGVYRGLVKVTNKNDGAVQLVGAGEMVRLENDGLHRHKLVGDRDMRKYNSNIRFKDEKLGNIIRAINTVNDDVQIKAADAVRNRRLTVAFANDSPHTMAMLLSEALHLQYIEQGNEIIIK